MKRLLVDDAGQRPLPMSPAKVQRIAHLLGIGILVSGLVWAAWIWHSDDGQAQRDDLASLGLALSPDDSAKYQRQVEVYSGKLGVLVDKWRRQASQLSHGKPLAKTIGVLSIFGATVCFLFSAAVKRVAIHSRNQSSSPKTDNEQ